MDKKKDEVDYAAAYRQFMNFGHGRSLKQYCEDEDYDYGKLQRYSRKAFWTKHTKLSESEVEGAEDYGKMVNDAVNYILDDEKAFKAFLKNGRIELSNSAAERMFRHIAMGRRNWLHSGSHDAAQNIAFMYSLYESCKLNELNFFDYINDVLTRLMKGETGKRPF